MNCKPGDLAVVIRGNSEYPLNGKIVEVLYLAPSAHFQLPDGYPHSAHSGPEIRWVVKFLGSPVDAPISRSRKRKTYFGTVRDAALRPIRGLPETETTDEQIKEPA